MAEPTTETMADGDHISRILAPTKGLLVRQKLDIAEIFCPAFQKRNKYKVASMPTDKGEDPEDWEDKTFKKALKHGKLFSMKEDSECCERICCLNYRAFTIKVTGSKKAGVPKENNHVATFHRPFKCCICHQEITSEDSSGNKLGRTQFDFRCKDLFCNTKHWKIEDSNGDVKYFLEDNQCCNANLFAPTLCCAERRLDIQDAKSNEVVGVLIDYFPGCGKRGCFGTSDNFRLVFPDDATPALKMQLLATVVLVDFMLFEKSDDDGMAGGMGGVM